jgi:predicted protein tyrosine phosphatase
MNHKARVQADSIVRRHAPSFRSLNNRTRVGWKWWRCSGLSFRLNVPDDESMSHPKKLLFIYSQNRMRSLTAEHMYQGFSGYAVKSAGTEPSARTRVNQGHIGWADIIFVMEKTHARILKENFGEALDGKTVICLRIPDAYAYMEPALINELKAALSAYVAVPE